MTGKRKRYSAEFKAKVALEAIRGELTVSQLVAKHGVHQTLINAWKKQAIEGMAGVISGKAEAAEASHQGEVEKVTRHLRRHGHAINRKRVRRLMGRMGLQAVYQRPKTTAPHPEHKVLPYLLRDMSIDRPNQVWCADITYIPMRRGFLYLVAVMDWASRRVLAWRLSNTMDVEFRLEAVEEAMAQHGRPEIFNTDQGSQFTSPRFTGLLTAAGIRVSMDGRGRWMDNVFIQRLWRSLKYECVYLQAFELGSEARAGIGQWIADSD